MVDEADVGDEYDYAPSAEPLAVPPSEESGEVRLVDDTGLRARAEARFVMPLPRSIAADRRRRSIQTVECETRVRVTMGCSSPVVEIELEFDNRATDHRLRAEFPTPIRTDTVISDGHFYINHRPVDFPDGTDWFQPPSGTYPQREFSLVQDHEGGLAILSRGLPEIAPFRTPDGRVGLALTLLRAVGWLSRDDLPTRRHRNAGPTLPTPDAQCPGLRRFHYAVLPFPGNHIAADVKGLSARYRTPIIAVQGVEDGLIPGGNGLFSKESNATAVSAVKQHASRDTLVVRLYNLTAEPVTETLTFGRQLHAAWRSDLLEERLAELAPQGPRLAVVLGAHEILTLEVELA